MNVEPIQPLALRRGVARRAPCGFVLPLALLFLALVALLALSGTSTAAVELLLAGHEQGRAEAGQAAMTGIEFGIARLEAGDAPSGAAPLTFRGSIANDSRARYDVTVRLAGVQSEGVEAGGMRFDIVHYEITSRGLAARNIVAEQAQGVALVRPAASAAGTPAPSVACFSGVEMLPRCVHPGRAVRTFWYSTEVR